MQKQMPPQPDTGQRILVADDDATSRLLMGEALRVAGFAVCEAADGATALSCYDEAQPVLVLLDIEMPGRDGFAVCAAIRQRPGGAEVPIVMVTGMEDAESIRRAFAAGATDFIVKPINPTLLQHRVRTLLAASAARRATAAQVRQLQGLAPDLAVVVNRDGRILEQLNQRTGDVIAAEADSLERLWPAEAAAALTQHARRALRARETLSHDFTVDEAAGPRSFHATFRVQGRDRVLVSVQETSRNQAADGDLYRLAYYDPATGFANAHLLGKILEARLSDARLSESGLAVLCVDFPELEPAMATLDDGVADDLLCSVARRLAELLRGADRVACLDEGDDSMPLARMADGRFAVLLEGIERRAEAGVVANRIRAAFAGDLDCGGRPIRLQPVIGISLYPQDARTAAGLLRTADVALREASALESTGQVFFSDTMRMRHPDPREQARELRWALGNGQLELHYQPRVELGRWRIIGAEALLRWRHPLRGYVPLNEMLPLAESAGLIVDIGDWVLRQACAQARAWEKLSKPPLLVSVNLSRQEFAREALLERLAAALAETGLEPQRLELELTERMLMRSRDPVADLGRLKAMGVGLALDDFGTGYSSLADLKRFPLDRLKIDKSFVAGIEQQGADSGVCASITELAHRLGLKVVAEGVETKGQIAFLRELGCDEIQGFLVSTALPPQEFEGFLARGLAPLHMRAGAG